MLCIDITIIEPRDPEPTVVDYDIRIQRILAKLRPLFLPCTNNFLSYLLLFSDTRAIPSC